MFSGARAFLRGDTFKKNRVFLIASSFLVIFALGLWGYVELDAALCQAAHHGTCPTRWGPSVQSHFSDTFALFLRSGNIPPNVPIPVPLAIARVLAPFVALFAVLMGSLKIMLADLRHDYRVARAQNMKGHVIVCGLGEIGLQIVENLRDRKRDRPDDVVGIDLEPGSVNAAGVERLGAIVVKGDARKPSVLHAAGIAGANTVVICAGEDASNIDIALGIKARIDEAGERRNPPLLALVELRDKWMFGRLIDHDKQALGTASVEIRLFNTYQNTARLLLQKMAPPPATGDAAKPIVIIGFGNMGWELAVQLLQAGFAPLGHKTRLVVFDREAEIAAKKFNPVLAPIAGFADVGFRACDFNFDSPSCWDEIGILLGNEGAAAVVVCVPDDRTSLYIAVELRSRLDQLGQQSAPVYARLGRHARLGKFFGDMEQLPLCDDRLVAFGAFSTILGVNILIGDRLDQLARACHANYLASHEDPPWERLAEQYKMSNRRLADHMRIALAQVGLAVAETKSPAAQPVELSPGQIELLARLGHRRWMIERLTQGWKWGATTDRAKRISALLVDWSELDPADREQNRADARKLPELLAAVGWQIAPSAAEAADIRPVPVIEQAAEPAPSEALA